jgi:hypothetical protein
MVGESLTSLRVSNCSQSDEPVGRIPIVEHLYSPRANLNDGNEDHHRLSRRYAYTAAWQPTYAIIGSVNGA